MDINSLTGVIPSPVLIQIPSVIQTFQINTPLRLSHFLSQCSHESANFNFKIENLNYGAEGLLKIFPKYFDKVTALQYQRNPEKIANRVYAGRYGNGDEKSGDGFKFRGRGFIQLTFKDNYTQFDKVVPENILDNPNLVSDKYSLLSAAWFWDSKKLNDIADLGAEDNVIKVRKVVNGGINGLNDVLKKFIEIYNKLKTS